MWLLISKRSPGPPPPAATPKVLVRCDVCGKDVDVDYTCRVGACSHSACFPCLQRVVPPLCGLPAGGSGAAGADRGDDDGGRLLTALSCPAKGCGAALFVSALKHGLGKDFGAQLEPLLRQLAVAAAQLNSSTCGKCGKQMRPRAACEARARSRRASCVLSMWSHTRLASARPFPSPPPPQAAAVPELRGCARELQLTGGSSRASIWKAINASLPPPPPPASKQEDALCLACGAFSRTCGQCARVLGSGAPSPRPPAPCRSAARCCSTT